MSTVKVAPSLVMACLGCLPLGVYADLQTGTNPPGNPNAAISRTARLDFIINIDKVLFLRVGSGGSFSGAASGTGPTADGVGSTISFNSTPAIPPAGTVPINGNSVTSSWNGAAPAFTSSAPQSLSVEVRSNAGQVSLVGQATTPLTSGANVLPMTSIGITTSDPNLPAPLVPNAGPGASVNVSLGGTGTGAASSLLTYRTANWTFGYTPVPSAAASVYTGAITFTATAP